MISRQLKVDVINLLKTLPVYHTNSIGTQHTVRCPYCGDSVKHADHAHFSIKIDINDDSPMVYNCLRCPVSGILNNDVLEELGLSLGEESYSKMAIFAKKSNRMSFNTSGEYRVNQFTVPYYKDNILNRSKLDYLNSRLGVNFDYDECTKLKILLNLEDFIRVNSIPRFANCKSGSLLNALNSDYIGFLSANNNVITMRNISNNSNMYRYYKLIIDGNLGNPNSFYGVPNSYNLLSTDPIKIHITEGTFDILSVYANLNNEDLDNNYYYAACGFGNVRIIKYLLYYGINTNADIHIYSDKDKSDKDHKKYLRTIKNTDLIWFNNLFIHRNDFANEKDYGVPLERIDDTFMKLKRNAI